MESTIHGNHGCPPRSGCWATAGGPMSSWCWARLRAHGGAARSALRSTWL